MRGKTYMYAANTYKILNYKIDKDEVHLVTDSEWLVFKISAAEKNLTQFLPVADGFGNEKLTIITNESSKKIIDTILSTIEEVRQNPEYVKQANAINQSVNALISLGKLEIQFKKLKA